MIAAAPVRPAGRYRFFFLAALAMMMFSIDTTIVAVAIPSLERGLQASLEWIGWTLTGYALTQTVMMPLAGKLSENFGRMRVFLFSVFLFTLSSLLCGLSPNIYVLICFRVLQAVGGGGMLPSAVGIVATEFPDSRDRMVGLFTSIVPLGGIIGPNLGGLILQYWSWREIFLVNVPIGAVVLIGLFRRLQTPEVTKRQRLDLAGAALFAGAIFSLLTAMTFLGDDPSFWHTPLFWGLLVASAALLVAFVRQERRALAPMIDFELVVRNPFLAVNIYNFFFGAATFGLLSFIPYYAVAQYHMSAAESGAVLTPRSLMVMSSSVLSSVVLIRLGYRRPMLAGLLLVITMLLLLTQGWREISIGGLQIGPFPILALEMAIGGLGIGISSPASNNAALDLMPERAAVMTGIRGMFRSTGGVIGTALIVLGLTLSADKAAGLKLIFFVVALIMALAIPLIFLIPDSARKRYLERRARARELG